MGNAQRRRFDRDLTPFLGADDQEYKGYLRYFYENNIIGDNDEKFEEFKSLFFENADIASLIEKEEIDMPTSSEDMLSTTGDSFFDRLTEEQAK